MKRWINICLGSFVWFPVLVLLWGNAFPVWAEGRSETQKALDEYEAAVDARRQMLIDEAGREKYGEEKWEEMKRNAKKKGIPWYVLYDTNANEYQQPFTRPEKILTANNLASAVSGNPSKCSDAKWQVGVLANYLRNNPGDSEAADAMSKLQAAIAANCPKEPPPPPEDSSPPPPPSISFGEVTGQAFDPETGVLTYTDGEGVHTVNVPPGVTVNLVDPEGNTTKVTRPPKPPKPPTDDSTGGGKGTGSGPSGGGSGGGGGG
ncbi:MAG TPA: hypothetical protein PLM79_12810 [Syntrophobacteraceae bacterium]|nr:hypothetical protein [Syntrophobacteraceae bacterium]